MFDIEYKGGNTVVISSKKVSIITDPKLSLVSLKDILIKDGIELATEPRFVVDYPDLKLAIDSPGEYGVADFDIRGVAAQRYIDDVKDEFFSTIYRVEIGSIRLAIIGNIDSNLSDAQLEEVGLVDFVIVPVGGGGYTLDAAGAVDVIKKIDPKVVIPVHYADDALHYEVPQDDLEEFIKALGAPVETTAKYKLKSSAALPQELTVVVVTRS